MLIKLLAANAIAAIVVAFYFQGRLIFALLAKSTLGQGIGDDNSFAANMMRFLNSDLWPDLKRRWAAAVIWVAASVLTLFVYGALYA